MTIPEVQTAELAATFQKCLKSPEPFASPEERETCRRLVEALPKALVPYAANTSYAYWYLSQHKDTRPTEGVQTNMAMREARRHLSYMLGDYDTALTNLVESLEYRKEHQLHLLKTCFDDNAKSIIAKEDQARSKELKELVLADMKKQYNIMRGHDTQNRTIMIKFPRVQTGTTEESYLMAQIYLAERSTATTEFRSLGREERSLAIYDYNGFKSNNAPPFQMQATIATTLQKLYPERLGMLVMMEPPFWLRGVLNLMMPFLSTSITERIRWSTGMEEKTDIFREMLVSENATPLMLKDGRLDTPISLAHFLEDVPFYGLYDDVPCERPITVEEKELHQTSLSAPAPSTSLTSSVWSSISSMSSMW